MMGEKGCITGFNGDGTFDKSQPGNRNVLPNLNGGNRLRIL